MTSVALVGSSGFVGSACARALSAAGWAVHPVPAPRLQTSGRTLEELQGELGEHRRVVSDLASTLRSCDTVVNAAGLAAPGAADSDVLFGANSLLPAVVTVASALAGAQRLVHISSAAVQGRRGVLDETDETESFSPYSRSKALGERVVLEAGPGVRAVVHRPTSVHGSSRRVTRTVARLAASPWSSVAGDGDSPTPQVHVDDVAAAVVFMVDRGSDDMPPIVLQPNGGMTTGEFFRLLGDRAPRRVPRTLAKGVARASSTAARAGGRGAATARRLEMMWFGQDQVPGWLSAAGFVPPSQSEDWRAMGREARAT